MSNLDTAKAVLAKASLFDQTFATPDLGIAVAWSEALGDIDRADALQAVTTHYCQPGPRRIMPGDVIAGVKAIRADRIRANFSEPEYEHGDVLAGLRKIREHRKALADGRPVVASDVSNLGDYRVEVDRLVRDTARALPTVPRTTVTGEPS